MYKHLTAASIPSASIPCGPIEMEGDLGNVSAQEEEEVGLLSTWHGL